MLFKTFSTQLGRIFRKIAQGDGRDLDQYFRKRDDERAGSNGWVNNFMEELQTADLRDGVRTPRNMLLWVVWPSEATIRADQIGFYWLSKGATTLPDIELDSAVYRLVGKYCCSRWYRAQWCSSSMPDSPSDRSLFGPRLSLVGTIVDWMQSRDAIANLVSEQHRSHRP